IASVSGWVAPGEWTKQASQQSVKVTLEAGKRYYIEAVMLEIWGDDHLAVGWQLPNGTLERPIAGNRLSPMGSTAPAATAPVANQAPSITLTAPTASATFETGKVITLTANAADSD